MCGWRLRSSNDSLAAGRKRSASLCTAPQPQGVRRQIGPAYPARRTSGIGNWDQPKHTTCRGRLIWGNPTYSTFWRVFGVPCPRMQRLASSVGFGTTARLAPRENLPDSDVSSEPGGCYAALHPVGMTENSPAFQRWDRGQQLPSPEGTAENHCPSRPFGTYPAGRAHPALKRWAILVCPSGTGAEPLFSDGGNHLNASGIGRLRCEFWRRPAATTARITRREAPANSQARRP